MRTQSRPPKEPNESGTAKGPAGGTCERTTSAATAATEVQTTHKRVADSTAAGAQGGFMQLPLWVAGRAIIGRLANEPWI